GGLGLIVGGLLVDALSYHWIFWLGAFMGAIAAIGTQLYVPESPVRTPGRIDVRGAAVLGVGLVLPLVAISRADSVGWSSPQTLVLIGAGLAVLVVWWFVERRTAEPLADVAMLANP